MKQIIRNRLNARGWLLAGLLVLLVAAGWTANRQEQPVSGRIAVQRVTLEPQQTLSPSAQPKETMKAEQTPAVEQPEKDFETYRIELEETRAASAQLLEEVLQDERAEDEIAQRALEQKMDLAKRQEMEKSVETLLRARGFEKSLCIASGDSVSILVFAQTLSQNQAAQILDIAITETGAQAGNVRIIPTL